VCVGVVQVQRSGGGGVGACHDSQRSKEEEEELTPMRLSVCSRRSPASPRMMDDLSTGCNIQHTTVHILVQSLVTMSHT